MNLCVYGAASNKISNKYKEIGIKLGEEMAKRDHALVFGGGASGMMGALAQGIYNGGGKSIAVSPTFFKVDGILFDKCTEYVYTDTMRERKQKMEELSDGFIVAPGGIGTMDEFMEILSLRQLDRHQKPIAILNIDHYYDPLLKLLENMIDENFMDKANLEFCPAFDDIDSMLSYLETVKCERSNLFVTRLDPNEFGKSEK